MRRQLERDREKRSREGKDALSEDSDLRVELNDSFGFSVHGQRGSTFHCGGSNQGSQGEPATESEKELFKAFQYKDLDLNTIFLRR